MGRPSLRDQLVQGSLDLLIARGYAASSVGDIVGAVGVPKGSFYSHFASKEDFAVEQVRRYTTLLNLPALHDAHAPARTANREHFTHQIDLRLSGELPLGCLLGTLSNGALDDSPSLRAAVRTAFDSWRAALGSALRRAHADGETTTDHDPTDVAAALIDGFQGALVRARAFTDQGPVESFVDLTVPALLGSAPLATPAAVNPPRHVRRGPSDPGPEPR